VSIVDDLSTGQKGNLDGVLSNPNLKVIHADLGDAALVKQVCEDVDVVYHLAAAVGVALIAKQPIQTIHRNIYPTQLLLEELRRLHLAGKKVSMFLASTSEVYGKNPKSVWTENDDLVFGATTKPRWSYGASKAIDEFLALACVRECNMNIVIGRFFNVVGPRQSGAYGMVLPRFISAAIAGKPLIVHDDGKQERCFAHVSDVVGAVVALMNTPACFGKIYNIGADQPVSILEMARRVIDIVNPKCTIEFQSYSQAYDDDFEDIRRQGDPKTRFLRW
jgi:UDP-glucose 4-epimerase